MTPEFLAALAKDPRLDAEILRRRRLREAREEQEWFEADPSGVLAGVHRLTRAINQVVVEMGKPRPAGSRPLDPDLLDRQREEWEEFEDQVGGIISGVERLIAVEADEEAGIERRCSRTHVRVRAVARTPPPPRPPPPRQPRTPAPQPVAASSPALSGGLGQAAAQAAPVAPQADGTGWQNGVVKTFNSVTLTGIVVVGTTTEMLLTAGVFRRSSLTVLSPGQRVKARIIVSPDGKREIDALELRASWNENLRGMADSPVSSRVRMNPVRERYAGW